MEHLIIPIIIIGAIAVAAVVLVILALRDYLNSDIVDRTGDW